MRTRTLGVQNLLLVSTWELLCQRRSHVDAKRRFWTSKPRVLTTYRFASPPHATMLNGYMGTATATCQNCTLTANHMSHNQTISKMGFNSLVAHKELADLGLPNYLQRQTTSSLFGNYYVHLFWSADVTRSEIGRPWYVIGPPLMIGIRWSG